MKNTLDLPTNFDNQQTVLKDTQKQSLFAELFNAEGSDVFENVVFEGKRRYYVEDLSVRDYLLENTTPYRLEILGHIIEGRSWGILLPKTTDLLLDIFPEYRENILPFKCQWSKQTMFSLEKKTNYKPLKVGLFINCNHTALHSCWFLQDLLDFFGVDKSNVRFLIHRPCGAEPRNVKDFIEKRYKKLFSEFLCNKCNKTIEYAKEVIEIIESNLNPMLSYISKSYTNFFLFDDKTIFSGYSKRIGDMIDDNLEIDNNTKHTFKKCLAYLSQFNKSK